MKDDKKNIYKKNKPDYQKERAQKQNKPVYKNNAPKKDVPEKRGRTEKPAAQTDGSAERESAPVSENTFAWLVFEQLKADETAKNNQAEPLSHLEYRAELGIKQTALDEYFKIQAIGSCLIPQAKIRKIEASPRPRAYRTTSKRRVIKSAGRVVLAIEGNRYNRTYLEPEEHGRIYEFLGNKLNQPSWLPLSGSLNYIIIRGNYEEFCVIFNVFRLDALIVRKLKLLSESLKDTGVNIASAYMYFDPDRSDYYFESRRPKDSIGFKKFFGKDKLSVKYGQNKYFYYPTAFSQINAAMTSVMLRRADEVFRGVKTQRLTDLFSGYGLFSYYLAGKFRDITGIDAEGASINSALEAMKYFSQQYPGTRFKFLTKRVTAEEVYKLQGEGGAFLLDPPRQGVEQGVIKAVASHRPEKVLHIFCGIERIPVELKEWKKNGYLAEEIIPLDMFPGTAGLEIMVSLVPAE